MRISDEEAATDPDGRSGGRLRARERRGRRARPAPRARAQTLSELRHKAPDAARRELPRRPCRRSGLHARVVDERRSRLLRAAGVPRRQRAGAGGHRPPVSAAGGRSLRRRPADQDPRPGGLRAVVPGGRRAARHARAAARGGARRACAANVAGAGRHRAGAGLGDRGGDRRVLPASGYERTAEAVVEAFAPEIERRARAPGRLQVGAAGAARPPRRAGQLRGDRRAGPAARPHVLGQREGRRARDRARHADAARRTPSRRPRRRRWRRLESDA